MLPKCVSNVGVLQEQTQMIRYGMKQQLIVLLQGTHYQSALYCQA